MPTLSAILPLHLLCQLIASNSNSSVFNTANLPQGYIPHSDIGFAFKIHDEKVTWQLARRRCIAEGAHLAVIDSQTKFERVSSQRILKASTMHVGIMRVYDQWINVHTGQLLHTLPWANREPRNVWNCVTMESHDKGLANWPCHYERAFVCEIPIHALVRNQTAKSSLADLPQGYIPHPDIGFALKIHDERVTWQGARRRCIAEGADLMVIDSQTKFERVSNQRSLKVSTIHIGILRMYDQWINVRTGQTLHTLPWAHSEPKNVWDCVTMESHDKGLANWPCHYERAFICEIPINALGGNQTANSSLADLPQGYVNHFDLGVALKYYDEELTWTEARRRCIGEGADLVSINSAAKSERVSSQRILGDRHMHVGVLRKPDKKQWTNVRTGMIQQTLPWAPKEPLGEWDCVAMLADSNRLGNWNCNIRRTYMCEIPING